MTTRQAASIATIRQERRKAGLYLWCGGPSDKTVCAGCRPPKGGQGGKRVGAGRKKKVAK